MRRLSVDELLERAASVANLAMLREYAEPSPIQIAAINEYTPLLEFQLRSLPSHDYAVNSVKEMKSTRNYLKKQEFYFDCSILP